MGAGAREVVEMTGYLYMFRCPSHELQNLNLLNALHTMERVQVLVQPEGDTERWAMGGRGSRVSRRRNAASAESDEGSCLGSRKLSSQRKIAAENLMVVFRLVVLTESPRMEAQGQGPRKRSFCGLSSISGVIRGS